MPWQPQSHPNWSIEVHAHVHVLAKLRNLSKPRNPAPARRQKREQKMDPVIRLHKLNPFLASPGVPKNRLAKKDKKMMLGPSHFLLHLLLALAISARQLRETDMKELTPLACPPAGWRSCQRRSTFTQSDHLQTIAFNKTCLWGRHASNKVFLLHPGKASSGGHQFHSISAHPLLLHRLRVDESRENSFRQRRKPSV